MIIQGHRAVEKRRSPGGRAEAISYLVDVAGTIGGIIYNKNINCTQVTRRDVDLDLDGFISGTDTGLIADHYNNISGDSTFSDAYDINCDYKLNIKEIARIGYEFSTR